MDVLGQLGVRQLPRDAGLDAGQPAVEAGSGALRYPAQSLDAEGAAVVLDELEATHQLVSFAKYFAARRSMSRSISSSRTCRRSRVISVSFADWAGAAGGKLSECPAVSAAFFTHLPQRLRVHAQLLGDA